MIKNILTLFFLITLLANSTPTYAAQNNVRRELALDLSAAAAYCGVACFYSPWAIICSGVIVLYGDQCYRTVQDTVRRSPTVQNHSHTQ